MEYPQQGWQKRLDGQKRQCTVEICIIIFIVIMSLKTFYHTTQSCIRSNIIPYTYIQVCKNLEVKEEMGLILEGCWTESIQPKVKEALHIERTPTNTRLKCDRGYELPGCWITTMKKLG